MTSVILQTAARPIVGLMLLVSLVTLLRGHNEPGGGFVGGLLFAAAFTLYDLAFGAEAARRLLRAPPKAFIGAGLLVAGLSAFPALFVDAVFMKGVWFTLPLPGFDGGIKIGTPVIFDIGVYLVVAGVLLQMVFALEGVRSERGDA